MRRQHVLYCLLALAWAAPCHARWASVPLDQLVMESDLVLVGTLGEVGEYTRGGRDYGRGVILVNEVLWGNVRRGERLALRWENYHGIGERLNHRQEANRRLVWLLTRGEGGTVRADYPWRVLPLSHRAAVAGLLSRPVVIRQRERLTPRRLTLAFRNTARVRRSFPSFAYREGRLVLGAGAALRLYRLNYPSPGRAPVSRLPGRLVTDRALPNTSAAPGTEYSAEFDVARAFRLRPGDYAVVFELKGYARATHSLYIH